MRSKHWFTLATEEHDDPVFFTRSPFRSNYFLMITIMMALSIFLGIFVMVRHWVSLPSYTVVNMAVIIIGMLVLWGRVLRDHASIQALFRAGKLGDASPGLGLERALRVAASMAYFGLFFTILLSTMGLASIGQILHGR